jgi:hypothetical protein
MNTIGQITYFFLKLRNYMKVFHWQTKSYAQHIASDNFVTEFDKLTDTFIETIQGSKNKRLSLETTLTLKNMNSKNIIKVLYSFRKFLKYDLLKIIKSDTDLINIRDDMIHLINKTLYLFTLQ